MRISARGNRTAPPRAVAAGFTLVELLVVVAIWVVQICFSILWTRRFRFGPMEWVWRSLTTWSIQPMTSGRAGST